MRTDVFINSRAGRGDRARIIKGVRQALYRCDLYFHEPATVSDFKEAIRTAVRQNTTNILICGGDGTMNVALNPLMEMRAEFETLPPIVLIPVGTANDLANDVKLSRRIDRAARVIFEGSVRTIDVLEIEAGGKKSYMITNGGLGIPAQTARRANVVRKLIKRKANAETLDTVMRKVWQLTGNLVSASGSRLYELLFLSDLVQWDDGAWEAEIDLPGRDKFRTKAPFIMISNQPSLGERFVPAPYTSNTDGAFNVMFVESHSALGRLRTIYDIRQGKLPGMSRCPSFETREVCIKASDLSRPLTFFGDGEILHKGVREICVRCVHPGLPIYTTGGL